MAACSSQRPQRRKEPFRCLRDGRWCAFSIFLISCFLSEVRLGFVQVRRQTSPLDPRRIGARSSRPWALRAQGTAPSGATPWSVLGLSRDAPRDEVKRAFRERIRLAHPDRGGSAELFQQVHWAYKTMLGKPAAPPAANQAQATSSSAWSRGAPAGWGVQDSVKDFYEARKEQVRQERQGWEQHADWHSQGDWRQRWPGYHQRRQDEDARRREEAAERIRVEDELERVLRIEAEDRVAAARRTRGGNAGREFNSNVNKWDWFEADPRGQERQATDKAQSQHPGTMPEGTTIVGYRWMVTLNGSERVPVFQASGGDRYYFSPISQRKVKVPM